MRAISPVVKACFCFIVLEILKGLGFKSLPGKREVARRLDVAPSNVYERVPGVETTVAQQLGEIGEGDAKNDDKGTDSCDAGRCRCASCACPFRTRERVEKEMWKYRAEHPGAWTEGGHTTYGSGVRPFVLDLARRMEGRTTQAEFAEACGIPLPTLKDWWAEERGGKRAQLEMFSEVSPSTTTTTSPSAPEPSAATDRGASSASAPTSPTSPTPPVSSASPEPATPSSSATPPSAASEKEAALCGLPLEIIRLAQEWNRFEGSFGAFVRYVNEAGLWRYGKTLLVGILYLAASYQLVGRDKLPPPEKRGSTYRPPPNAQLVSDGMELKIVFRGQTHKVNWQPMIDMGSGAGVGSVVRKEEDSQGVIDALNAAIQTTGSPPYFVLLDNKACNDSEALKAALPDGLELMHATLGRPQNKAVIEGGVFGLFSQDLGDVFTIHGETDEEIVLAIADAITQAYIRGRNHRPRRKDGLSPYEIFNGPPPSPEKLAEALNRIREIKNRIDRREEREAARRDPRVAALLEEAFGRFGFTDDGQLLHYLRGFTLDAIESAIARYGAMFSSGTLPLDAGLDYFAGIARHCRTEIYLRALKRELADALERGGHLTTEYLRRQAAEYRCRALRERLRAIVDELVTTAVPLAEVFWRRELESAASEVPVPLRVALRDWLCARVIRAYKATRPRREELIELITRLLTVVREPGVAA